MKLCMIKRDVFKKRNTLTSNNPIRLFRTPSFCNASKISHERFRNFRLWRKSHHGNIFIFIFVSKLVGEPLFIFYFFLVRIFRSAIVDARVLPDVVLTISHMWKHARIFRKGCRGRGGREVKALDC